MTVINIKKANKDYFAGEESKEKKNSVRNTKINYDRSFL